MIPILDLTKKSEDILYEGVYIFGGIKQNIKSAATLNEKLYIFCLVAKDKNLNQSFVLKSEEELDKKPTG